jgi:hypothetical protein
LIQLRITIGIIYDAKMCINENPSLIIFNEMCNHDAEMDVDSNESDNENVVNMPLQCTVSHSITFCLSFDGSQCMSIVKIAKKKGTTI